MRGSILNLVDDAWTRLKVWAVVAWRLPVVPCPACGGAGGQMSGYYEPEWVECWCCWPQTQWLADYDRGERFVGRIHPLRWPWAKLAASTGHASFHGFLLCKCGFHDRGEYGFCDRCCRPCGKESAD